MTKHDRFIVFLSFSLIFLALIAKYFFPDMTPLLSLSSSQKIWRINEEKAWKIINDQKEIKRFLDQGEIRKEDKFGITISQPKLILTDTPTEKKPFWEFQVFEEVVEIPKEGSPSSHSATFNWYQINADNGQIKAVFTY